MGFLQNWWVGLVYAFKGWAFRWVQDDDVSHEKQEKELPKCERCKFPTTFQHFTRQEYDEKNWDYINVPMKQCSTCGHTQDDTETGRVPYHAL